jgi:large subunit ribosomal protein L14
VIQQESRLRVADNTGAKEILCIRVLGGSGDATRASATSSSATVKDALPGAGVKRGRRRQGRRRPHRQGAPSSRRLLHPLRRERRGDHPRQRRPARHPHLRPVGRELRDKRFMRIISLAPEVL